MAYKVLHDVPLITSLTSSSTSPLIDYSILVSLVSLLFYKEVRYSPGLGVCTSSFHGLGHSSLSYPPGYLSCWSQVFAHYGLLKEAHSDCPINIII